MPSDITAPTLAALNAVQWHLSGPEVEAESFARIDALRAGLCSTLPVLESDAHWRLARRLIHTAGDPDIATLVRFQQDPLTAGREALRRHAIIFCDSSMIRSGISLARLRTMHPEYSPEDIRCHIADADVAAQAKNTGHTRALCAAEKARPHLHGAIVLVGNAPLALARICRFILEEDVRPALLLAMPVGFVNVEESKALLPFCPVPSITVCGRRGGSPLAVAALHALMEDPA